MSEMVVGIFVAFGVILLVGGMALVFNKNGSVAEQRLDGLSGKANPKSASTNPSAGILLRPSAIDVNGASIFLKFLPNPENLNKLYEQADVNLSFNKFMAIVGVLSVTGGLVVGMMSPYPYLAPLGMITLGGLPFAWLNHRKQKRIKKFLEAMPEAVELISRALRAGHGLASGLKLAAEELKGPISDEFGRVFEEQNFGIPIEVALRAMADRIPSMDVRFFVIAVAIQRATGGDLAEVLDKIGRLIRQRFELFGHVRGLTAEGRLSGIVLLALPPGLLAFLSVSNYAYVSPLFNTPVGHKMLIITVVMQIIGAFSIKKIVAIKV